MSDGIVLPPECAAYEALLKRYHADTTAHSGRTFLDHLKGTYQLLKNWEMPEHVCVAGLFHSIYGTNLFTVQSAPFEDRHVIQEVIGIQAERLAYLFCKLGRPMALITRAAIDGKFYDLSTREPIEVSNTERLELIAIEVANHIEQNMGAKIISLIWDRPVHNVLMTQKAMNDMRRFMYRHGIVR